MGRWTSEECGILAMAPTLAIAQAALPHRDPESVRARWWKTRGTTKQRRTTPLARANDRDVTPHGRPPQTADEWQVARILQDVRCVARATGSSVDVGLLLLEMRAIDWRHWRDPEPDQATPQQGWTR